MIIQLFLERKKKHSLACSIVALSCATCWSFLKKPPAVEMPMPPEPLVPVPFCHDERLLLPGITVPPSLATLSNALALPLCRGSREEFKVLVAHYKGDISISISILSIPPLEPDLTAFLLPKANQCHPLLWSTTCGRCLKRQAESVRGQQPLPCSHW